MTKREPRYCDLCVRSDRAGMDRPGGTTMTDVVVTCPQSLWAMWLEEGDLPREPWSGEEFHFYLWGGRPAIEPGERVYVVAYGRLRGYAPLVRIDDLGGGRFGLVRHGGAVACTIPDAIRGFRGWRYRDWERDLERPYPLWETDGVPQMQASGLFA